MDVLVGRDSKLCHFVVPQEFDSVGRVHLKIRNLGGGIFLVSDNQTTNGTEVLEGGKWRPVKDVVEVPGHASFLLGEEYRLELKTVLESVPGLRETHRDDADVPYQEKPERRPRARRLPDGSVVVDDE